MFSTLRKVSFGTKHSLVDCNLQHTLCTAVCHTHTHTHSQKKKPPTLSLPLHTITELDKDAGHVFPVQTMSAVCMTVETSLHTFKV